MDDADRAGPLVEAYHARALKRALRSAQVPAAECVGCGDPIDAARRAAVPSARRCVACQKAFERMSRRCRRG